MFQAFSQTKSVFDTITGDNPPPKPLDGLGKDPTDVERAAHNPAQATYSRALDDIEKRKNNLWCYLAMVLGSTSLMLVRYNCVDNRGLGDGRKTRVFLSAKFWSDETLSVVRIIQQLARLKLKEDEALHSYFIRAQYLTTRPKYAGEHLSEPLLNAMVLNGLPESYEHFVVRGSFNLAGSFTELRTRLLNYGESRKHAEAVGGADSHVAIASRKTRPKHISSSMYNASPMSSSGQVKLFCCGMKGHIKTECYEKDKVGCSYCKQNET